MGLRTQQLKGLNGGLNAVAQDLEGLEGPTQSPDLLNCYGLPGTVFSRLGSAPWWDTGGTGPLYWFSFFSGICFRLFEFNFGLFLFFYFLTFVEYISQFV